MLVIRYFNFLGTPEQLEEFVTAVKKAVKKTPGTKYLGKFGAMNQNWHWASVLDIKDWETFAAFAKNMEYNRDYKTMPNFVIEFLV